MSQVNFSSSIPHCVRFLSQNRPGPRMGMGHYERLLFHHLIQKADAAEWQFDILFSGRHPDEQVDPERLEPGIHRVEFLGFSAGRLSSLPWPLSRAAVGLGDRASTPELYHSLALSFPAPKPAIYTIHDLPPARFSDEGSVPSWAGHAAREARAIMTPSNFAKNELVELLEVPAERVHVIPYGCEFDVFNPEVAPAEQDVLSGYGINGRFLLYAGGFTQRKNVPNLLSAWRSVSDRHRGVSLALAGPAQELSRLVEESKATEVVVVGYLDRAVIGSMMRASEALVFPSIYEGFGLPPLEALALGVPVVAVRAGAVPEVVGDAALLAPDGSPQSLAEAIDNVLNNTELTHRLRQAGPMQARKFSWDEHAQRVLALYREILSQ